jgi:hypothetical protein
MTRKKHNMILTKDAILKADDLKRELVSVPEWGGDVYVRGMTGADRDKFEASIIQMRGKDQTLNMVNIRAKLASMTICDEAGKLLFSEADIKGLSLKSASALQRVFAVAQKLSGIGESDVKELAEGLQENPLEGSVSGLPLDLDARLANS